MKKVLLIISIILFVINIIFFGFIDIRKIKATAMVDQNSTIKYVIIVFDNRVISFKKTILCSNIDNAKEMYNSYVEINKYLSEKD